MKLSIPYIAGLIDGDGSFQLQVAIRKNGSFIINSRATIGMKHLPKEEKLLRQIQKYFNAGKIYVSNRGKENAVIRWMTTNVNETTKICKAVKPYLRIKEKQCQQLLWACELVESKKQKRYCKGYLTRSKDIYSKAEMLKIAKIATTMNAGMQTNRFRKVKGRDTQYYVDQLNEIYD